MALPSDHTSLPPVDMEKESLFLPHPSQVRSGTLAAYQDLLLKGAPSLSAVELAERLDLPLDQIEHYLLGLGFSAEEVESECFTEADLQALERWKWTVEKTPMTDKAAASLARAQSHLADRLALWQIEALVEDVQKRRELEDIDDTSARIIALNDLRSLIGPMEEHMVYAWRRQMYSLIERMTTEIASRSSDHSKRRFPLSRAFGFVDMSSYTATAALMGADLVGLVDRFEYLCRTTVTAAGGRVVKMIGDSVFFITDTLETGLVVVTDLIESLKEAEDILPVRASFIQGDVFSRSGDVFGPSVNLAARLVDIAPRWSILTDARTAAAIDASGVRSEYEIQDFPSTELRGLGRVSPYRLSKRV